MNFRGRTSRNLVYKLPRVYPCVLGARGCLQYLCLFIEITDFDADEMVHEIKGFPLLNGYRGAPKVDLAAIKALLLKVSQFAIDYPAVD